jgi:HEAT repeat protein
MARVVFIGVLIALFTLPLHAADDTTFNGLKASEWLAMAKDDPLPRKRKAAVLALGQLAVDKTTRDTILPGVAKAMRNDSSAVVRQQAALVMAQQPAEPLAGYITELSEGLRQEKDSGVKREIATALGRIGKAAQAGVAPLIDALKDTAPATRAAAAEALGRIGGGAHPAADTLIALTKDADRSVRYGAAFALGRIDPADPDAAAAALVTMLDGEKTSFAKLELQSSLIGGAAAMTRSTDVATAGLVSLGLIGVKTKAVAVAMAVHLADPDADVRQQAALALGKLTIAARNAEAELKRAISADADSQVRIHAVQTLAAACGNDPPAFIAFLAERLPREPAFEVRVAMVDELGALGTAAVPVLLEASKDTQVKVREAAAAALRRIRKPPAKVEP